MIIGGSKKEVINNIKVNIKNNELNKKVEVNDPCISDEELEHIINYLTSKNLKIVTLSSLISE